MSDGTLDTAVRLLVSSTGLSPSSVGLPIPFDYVTAITFAVRTPRVFLLSVWPLPLSLATTRGISFDFSSWGYLDVSVPQVPFLYLWIQYRIYDSSS